MGIEIRRSDGLYTARVTPPHGGEIWETSAPMTEEAVIKALLARGCHQTDIGDTLDELDRNGSVGRIGQS